MASGNGRARVLGVKRDTICTSGSEDVRRWRLTGSLADFMAQGQKRFYQPKRLPKMSCRLVPDQDPNKVFELVKAQLLKLTDPLSAAKYGCKQRPTLLSWIHTLRLCRQP